MKYISILVLALTLLFGAVGCTNMNKTQQGAVTGGVIGAGVGAGVGALAGGHWGWGAAIGSAVGATAGGLIGNALDNSTDADQNSIETPSPRQDVPTYQNTSQAY